MLNGENMTKIKGTIGYIGWSDDQQVYKATILLNKDEARKIRVGEVDMDITEKADKQESL